MSDFGGPGPSSGVTGQKAKGSRDSWRGRGRGSARRPGGSRDRRGSEGTRGFGNRRGSEATRGSAGQRAASQPPWGRRTPNPGPGLLGAFPLSSTNSYNQSSQKDARHNTKNTKDRPMVFRMLEEMSQCNSVDIIERISKEKKAFTLLLETPVEKKKQDVFALVLQIISNLSKTSFKENKKLLLLEICNSKFIDHLQLYLTQLPYCKSEEDKFFNGYYWKKENEFWGNFMTFCELIMDVSPSTAVRKCGSLIEATSKICLEGLKAKHGFELPEEYVERMARIRNCLTNYENEPQGKKRRIDCTAHEAGEPPESFRDLGILPTPEELIADMPYLRPNVVKGAYADKEHYLDVQFRLLREDCFGPLRDGIHQFIQAPNKRKYDNIRVYHNVKFLEPFVSKQKVGSLVLLDENTMKRFRNVNWAHSKRFLFGSLVLFTKDNCKSFLIGTILERDEKYLSQRQLPVSLVDAAEDSELYNDDSYTMIECEVYFEPYYHVLKALQDPNFSEHLAMSSYIIDVQKVPEKPAYLSPDTIYSVQTDEDVTHEFTVLQDETWPSESTLGLNSTQYEAYKLALTHEFAVIQGPPGTGKTFLGVKIAQTLLKNLTSSILVICYTNHALDQFLEALLPVTKSIVRIGGRSRNEALQKLNINELRREDDRYMSKSNFHEKRINLKLRIGELERAQAQLAELTYTSVLSCKSMVEHVEECKIIEIFYRGSGIDDPLYHWLFEDMDSAEIEPLVEGILQEHEASNVNNENQDVNDDIYKRNDIIFDDIDFDDNEDHNSRRGINKVKTSFTIHEAEKNIESLLKELKRLQTEGPAHVTYKKMCDLRVEIGHHLTQIKRLKDMMAHRTRAPKINLRNVQDVTNIPLIERWSLYFKWSNVVLQDLKKEIKYLQSQLKSAAEAYDEARMIVDLAVLKKATVVGMTTSGAARLRKLLAEIKTPIVVVEEAAEVLEAHIVTSLTKYCEHLILIGDHQQLRPSAASLRLARHYELEVSLFERMIRNGVHSRRLGVQHRMRPALAALVCPHIYRDLRNHPSVEEFPRVRGLAQDLFFFTHERPEQCEADSASRTNSFEGDMALRLANYLMQQGYKPEDVTILAAYSGQMFYMRKQRPLYPHLSKVKITVLDNYQGEESKIIVLSLVRNNSHDSIGFLGTENRICVALSRAREGFYMFGNIDLLKRNSPLWSNIEATLTQNGSVGKYLELICSNHNDNITKVETVDDFLKVPEGGCLLGCKGTLPCEHPCPRVCHSYDPKHSEIICTSQTCNRQICKVEGHSCPLACAKKCPPCNRSVTKSLPCGHSKELACHVDPAASTVHCSVVITVNLPKCGHEVEKQCYMKLEDVRCTKECLNRLDCGHVCRRKCHVKDDPEHKRYSCMQQCPKAKKGCTAQQNLEDDLGPHKCLRSCFEPCIDCNVLVVKKRSECKHKSKVECHEDVNATPCREKCARSLPCTHFCKKLCFERCGDCKQKVKKVIPGCGHEIEIDCGIDPTREHCKRECERVMTCGHVCPGRCDQPCDQTKCTKIMDRILEAPCGHKVQLPCNVVQSMADGVIDLDKLSELCTAPCGVILRCGHSCSGSCAGCRQGRLHAPCAAVCQQLNICGHRCEEPCSQVCPPCPKRCEVKCPHSKCGRLCGEPCVPCAEKCERSCPHSRCERACGVTCERAPCSQPCPERQPCGHPCRGLCGEPCPRACRVCDPEHFPTNPFMLGDPYEDDDILIQLQDCAHIMDVRNLDNYMKSKQEEVQIKSCLVCRTPIINTYRYKNVVNKLLRNDINPIKEKVYGTNHQRQTRKAEMLKTAKKLMGTYVITAKGNAEFNNACHIIFNIIKACQKKKSVSLLQLEMHDVYLNILDKIGKYYIKYKTAKVSQLEPQFNCQMKLLCNVLATNAKKISEQQQVDIRNELRRFNSIIQLDKILSNNCYTFARSVPNVIEATKAAKEAVLSWRVFDQAKAVECLEKLQGAVKLSGIASAEERAMVVKAVGLKAGHWYKCPAGHFYCIGECGGAMELAACPECGAAIGGRGHALTAGNRHAPEMDGSRFAAWSEQANNMANFNFNY